MRLLNNIWCVVGLFLIVWGVSQVGGAPAATMVLGLVLALFALDILIRLLRRLLPRLWPVLQIGMFAGATVAVLTQEPVRVDPYTPIILGVLFIIMCGVLTSGRG